MLLSPSGEDALRFGPCNLCWFAIRQRLATAGVEISARKEEIALFSVRELRLQTILRISRKTIVGMGRI
jgi:hypothetical protein